MPRLTPPECINDAFELYLKYNGERFDLIEKEMRERGWRSFDKQCLFNRGKDEHFREGWIEKYGWHKALELYLATKSKTFLTSGEKLLNEVETIREKLFERLQTHGVENRDLVWQHDKYAQRSAEILEQIEKLRNPLRDFAEFWKFLVTSSIAISPVLARELVNAEEAIIKRAKEEFSQ